MFLINLNGQIASWNEGARRIFGYEAAEIIAQPAALLFTPEDRANGAPEQELTTATREGRAADVRWHLRKDGTRFWADGIMERLTDDTGDFIGFAKVLRDATSEKEAVTGLAESEQKFRTLFEAIDVGFCVLQMIFDEAGQAQDYRFLDTNPAFERHTGLVNGIGKTARELVPNLDEFWFRTYGNVALTGESTRFENHAPAMGRWFDVYAVRVGPAEDRKVALLFTDITVRKEAQEALRSSEEQLREAQTRLEVALSAGEIATWMFDVVANRVVADANLARLFSVDSDAAAGGELGVYLQAIHDEDRAHVAQAIGEAIADKNDYEAEYRVVLPDGSYRWLVARGKVERDAHGQTLTLPGVVVDITARKELERERERLLAEARARAEQEALLNRISAAVRERQEPEDILRAAVSLLGQGLRADRTYFIRYDQARNSARVSQEWLRPDAGLEPLTGRLLAMTAYSINRDAAFVAGNTHVVPDAWTPNSADADALGALQIRSLLRVPIAAGNQMTALTVTMACEPRTWTQDEIRLVENVAVLLRSTLEAAHVQQRERNIAQQLQAALQPPAPENLPRLALEGFYRPALAEAGVGGDFYDVFPLDKGSTALVVGDLSGKGLAAASEVATVRNMVRYALYSNAQVSAAVTGLNHVLAQHNLLTGFATLFVGVFDSNKSTLTYANCGQEPGIIWRKATGEMEYLPPTGPVMGSFETNTGYDEQAIALFPGDVLALFTDGLTEVGPSRRTLLEVDGVAQIIRDCCANATQRNEPKQITECLIAGVDAYAKTGARDDIALLIGVAGDTSPGGSLREVVKP